MKHSFDCVECGKKYSMDEASYLCECGGLLDFNVNLDELPKNVSLEEFDRRAQEELPGRSSGVWRYKELVLPDIPDDHIISNMEGNTKLYDAPKVASHVGMDALQIKHEGDNPSGSFKDRGMTVAVSHANEKKEKVLACASTGNTSASMAAYAAQAGLKALVLIPENKVTVSKLAQALAYGAITVELEGDFDDCMELILESARREILYPMNSVNSFRPAGQKTIIWEILQQRSWNTPDWIIFPAGNLGNLSAFGLAIEEFYKLGFIKNKPRLVGVQAAGANPFYQAFRNGFMERRTVQADTIATAIRIGNPVNYTRAIRSLQWTNGLITQVTDQEIMDAKAMVDRYGIGAEPSSCAALAGLNKLLQEKVITSDESVVVIFTGHILKDPEAIISYHSMSMKGIKSHYVNKLLKTKPTMEELTGLLEKINAN